MDEGDTNVWTKFHGNPSGSCWDISVWTKVDWPLNLLEWWQCRLVHVAASLWRADSQIVSFFIWTFCENCTCINKPTAIRIKQSQLGWATCAIRLLILKMLQMNFVWVKGVYCDYGKLTEARCQADTVTPVETSFSPGHVRSHHHTFI